MGFRSPIIVMGTCTLCLTCETLQGNTSTQGTDTMTHRTACGSVAMDICSTRQLSVYATVSLLRTSEAVEPPNHAVERTGHSGHPWLAWGGTVWPSAHRQRSVARAAGGRRGAVPLSAGVCGWRKRHGSRASCRRSAGLRRGALGAGRCGQDECATPTEQRTGRAKVSPKPWE